MSFDRIAFIGAGNMAYAIAQGLVRSGRINPCNQFHVYAPSDRNLGRFQQAFRCRTSTDISTLHSLKRSDLVFICVKPSILHEKTLIKFNQDPLIISVAAGIGIKELKSSIVAPQDAPFVRIMTNTACSLGASVCAAHIDPSIVDEERVSGLKADLTSLLGHLGEVHFVQEDQLDTITAVTGSGPAYGLMFIQAISDAGVKMGLPRLLAQRLAALSISSAASLVLQSENEHPIAIRDRICSPGGTTIHGIHALERSGYAAGIMDAIEAATVRARQLAVKK